MEEEIKQTKKELLDCIHNLMGVFDTPVARTKIEGEFVNEVRKQARKIMEDNNRSCYNIE